jgi:hypothetical protein
MFLTWIAFLLMASIALGWGLALWRLYQCINSDSIHLPLWGEIGIFGLFTLGALATVVNFFSEIGSRVAISVSIIGILLFAFFLIRGNSARRNLSRPFLVLACVLSVFLTASLASLEFRYDAGLYHLPMQLWIRNEPIAFGLANFHDRFGFNSIQEPLDALFWLPDHNFALVAIISTLFFFFFFSAILESLLRESRSNSTLTTLFCILSPLSFLVFHDYFIFALSANDSPAGILYLMTVLSFLQLLAQRHDKAKTLSQFFSVNVLTIFAVTLKLSSISLFLLLAASYFVVVRTHLLSYRRAFAVALFAACLLAPAVLRGIALSGCMAFPVTQTCIMALSWSAESKARSISDGITGWARAPGPGHLDHVTGWDWLPSWFDRNSATLLSLFATSLFLVGLLYLFSGAIFEARPAVRGSSEDAETAVVPTLTSLIVLETTTLIIWFLKAPDMRFGIGPLHLFTLLPALAVFGRGKMTQQDSQKPFSLAQALVLSLVLFGGFQMAGWSKTINLLKGDQFDLIRIEPRRVEVLPDSVFGVRPVTGNQCWITEQPCAPSRRRSFSVERQGQYTVFIPK